MHTKFTLLLLLAFCIVVNWACMISRKKSEAIFSRANQETAYDAIIVPGVPFENGKWSPTMKGRVLWAVFLYKKGITRNIIFSGSSVYTPYVEAKIMALYAASLGVDTNHMIMETQAEHSTENVFYGYKLALKKEFKKIALASDRFQTKTLKSFIRKKKMKVDLLPMVEDSVSRMPHDDPQIDPRTAYVNSFVSILERESFFERFRGTLGKNIKEN